MKRSILYNLQVCNIFYSFCPIGSFHDKECARSLSRGKGVLNVNPYHSIESMVHRTYLFYCEQARRSFQFETFYRRLNQYNIGLHIHEKLCLLRAAVT